MLSHCANPQCIKPFLHLREGKLFLVETKEAHVAERVSFSSRKPPQRVERFWLCDRCAPVWTLIHDASRGITLVPLPPQMVAEKESAGDSFRQVISTR
jgi:hypothetical protein